MLLEIRIVVFLGEEVTRNGLGGRERVSRELLGAGHVLLFDPGVVTCIGSFFRAFFCVCVI